MDKRKLINTLLKITAVFAVIIGLLSVLTGTSVLLKIFDPGYQFFILLIFYNMIMGFVSIVAGILIWKKNSRSLLVSYVITCFHIIVLLLLITIFKDVISSNSIGAMAFRSVIWIIFSLTVRKGNLKT